MVVSVLYPFHINTKGLIPHSQFYGRISISKPKFGWVGNQPSGIDDGLFQPISACAQLAFLYSQKIIKLFNIIRDMLAYSPHRPLRKNLLPEFSVESLLHWSSFCYCWLVCEMSITQGGLKAKRGLRLINAFTCFYFLVMRSGYMGWHSPPQLHCLFLTLQFSTMLNRGAFKFQNCTLAHLGITIHQVKCC